MPRIKVARKSTATDMTAMCDVAFLLLTFFILTATARQPEPLPVDTPASTVVMPLPDTDVATITIGGGKVFFGVPGQPIRIRTLENMSKIYGIEFTDEEKKQFSLMESFGVPIGNLKQIIKMKPDERNKLGFQTGIPTDSIGTARPSELFDWIKQARYATRELNKADLRISIKGDSKEEYPVIKNIINILQSQQVNKFSLITSLRGDQF